LLEDLARMNKRQGVPLRNFATSGSLQSQPPTRSHPTKRK
jgi:hypothetical protein